MSGVKPKFLEGKILNGNYYAQPSPYENVPSCHVNLLELSRYAKQCGKELIELTSEEVNRFMIQA
ncbi:MAG: hypothetical protein IJ794_19770 [Lachnospiraceae bacterium]|nr:hypothetical protein [Lachnospiraceae bacterium]